LEKPLAYFSARGKLLEGTGKIRQPKKDAASQLADAIRHAAELGLPTTSARGGFEYYAPWQIVKAGTDLHAMRARGGCALFAGGDCKATYQKARHAAFGALVYGMEGIDRDEAGGYAICPGGAPTVPVPRGGKWSLHDKETLLAQMSVAAADCGPGVRWGSVYVGAVAALVPGLARSNGAIRDTMHAMLRKAGKAVAESKAAAAAAAAAGAGAGAATSATAAAAAAAAATMMGAGPAGRAGAKGGRAAGGAAGSVGEEYWLVALVEVVELRPLLVPP